MKQRFTQAKKANRLCIRYKNTTSDPVWLRRLHGIYGADFREFDKKHTRVLSRWCWAFGNGWNKTSRKA